MRLPGETSPVPCIMRNKQLAAARPSCQLGHKIASGSCQSSFESFLDCVWSILGENQPKFEHTTVVGVACFHRHHQSSTEDAFILGWASSHLTKNSTSISCSSHYPLLCPGWCKHPQSCTQVVAKAKVPIIKFVENESSVNFDISFDVPNGPIAAGFVRDLMETLPPMKPLVLVLKIFLQQRAFNEVTSLKTSYNLNCVALLHQQALQQGSLRLRLGFGALRVLHHSWQCFVLTLLRL